MWEGKLWAWDYHRINDPNAGVDREPKRSQVAGRPPEGEPNRQEDITAEGAWCHPMLHDCVGFVLSHLVDGTVAHDAVPANLAAYEARRAR